MKAVAFLCAWALACSVVIGHEHEKHRKSEHHHLKSQVKHAAHHLSHRGHHVLHHKARDNNNDVCGWKWTCSSQPGTGSGLQLLYRESANLIGVVNTTSRMALVIEYSSGIIVLFDGQSGTTIVVNGSAQTVLSIANSQSASTVWLADKKDFEAFFQNLNIQTLVDSRDGQHSSFENTKEPVLKAIAKILSSLIGNSNLETSTVLSKLTDNIKPISESLKGNLKALFKGNGSVIIRGNILRLGAILQGLGKLFGEIQGGLSAGLNNQEALNLTDILNRSSGPEILLGVLAQIGKRNDLSKLLGGVLNNPEKLLEIIVDLGGTNESGLDGIIKIIYQIISAVKGNGSLQKVIQAVLKFSSEGGSSDETGPQLSKVVNDLLELSRNQNQLFRNSEQLEGFVNFLKNLNDDNFILNGVNISAIIKLLRGDPKGGIDLVVKILTNTGNIFGPSHGIPKFFQHVLGLLNGTASSGLISHLIPGGLNISQFTGSNNILQSALKGFNLTQILGENSDPTSALSHIPIIGPIIGQFTHSIQSATNGALGFEKIFDPSTILENFQSILGGGKQGGIGGIFSNIASGIQNAFNSIIGGGVGGNVSVSA